MKRYNIGLFVRLGSVVLCSMLLGITAYEQWYGLLALCIMLDSVFVYSLVRYLTRNGKDMQCMIDAVRFHELNISFKHCSKKGLYPDLLVGLEQAIKQFNERMERKETTLNFYDILLNRVDTGLIVVDDSHTISWINKAALQLLGKPIPYNLVDRKESSDKVTTLIDELLPGDTRTLKIRNKQKEYRVLATVAKMQMDGREYKLIGLKNIQSALDENEGEAWKKMVSVLTHEMMNSLSPIISLSDTFSKQSLRDDAPELIYGAMQTIHRRSKGLVEFVNNYKKITHLPSPVFTTFTAEELIDDIHSLLIADGVCFSHELKTVDMPIEADRSQLEQVLINILKNAWEAASIQNNPLVHIEVKQNEYQRPIITISDNGRGIPDEQLERIFIPFYSTKKTGSGIGLSICRQIINAHGGILTVQSSLESGTAFTIEL